MPVSSKLIPGVRSIWDARMTRFFARSTALGRDVEIARIAQTGSAPGWSWMVHLDHLHICERGDATSRREAARAVRRAIRRHWTDAAITIDQEA